MTWHDIRGHDENVERFRRAFAQGRLASSFLFVGPGGIGKRTFAMQLAQTLLCEGRSDTEFDACGTCPACQQVNALSHPDLEVVSKPADKNFIPVEFFIGEREKRMREGLCHNLALKPFRGGRKVAIIDDADFLNQEGANCLLKTLEEPPPNSIIILIGTSEQRQLPTIRSRCQVVRFQPLPETTVAELLKQQLVDDVYDPDELAALGAGSIQKSLSLADPELQDFRTTLLKQLSDPDVARGDFAKTLIGFVDEAGKEASPRRNRMRQLADCAADFYAQLMRSLSGLDATGDNVLRRAVADAAPNWPGGRGTAADCLQRCLDVHAHVAANANQATLLECWLDDLTNICHATA